MKTFQTDLKNTLTESPTSGTYTAEHIAAGVEALINIATTKNRPRTAHQSKSYQFTIENHSQSVMMSSIYTQAYNAYRSYYLSTDTTEVFPVAILVEVDSVRGSKTHITVTAVLGKCNTCTEQHQKNSEPRGIFLRMKGFVPEEEETKKKNS